MEAGYRARYPPAPKVGDILLVLHRRGFDEDALDAGSIIKAQRADAEWGRDAADELPEAGRIQRPDFHRDGRRAAAQQSRPGRRGIGQGVERVVRRGGRRATDCAAELDQFGVERQAAQVRADHGNLDPACYANRACGRVALDGGGNTGEVPV